MARFTPRPLTVQVGPATEEERAALMAHMDPCRATAALRDWCLVACRVRIDGVNIHDVVLLGHIPPSGPGIPWRSRLTSSVVAFDAKAGFVRTVRSVYEIRGPEEQPNPMELERIGTIMGDALIQRLRRPPPK